MSVANILGENEIILKQYLEHWKNPIDPNGPAGTTGPTGETGPQGPQGDAGPVGFPGFAGSAGAFAYYYSNYTSPVQFIPGQAFAFTETGYQNNISIAQNITSPFYTGGTNVPGSEITLKNIGNYLVTYSITLSRSDISSPISYIVSVAGALGTNISGSESIVNNSIISQFNYNNFFPPGSLIGPPAYTNLKCTFNITTTILNTKLMIVSIPPPQSGDPFTMDPFCSASVLIRQLL